MALPVVKNATFTVKLNELKKPLKIRPMLMSEHKTIQQVTDIGSENDIAITISEIVASCTDNVITSTSVPQFVSDFVFLQIYMSSVEGVVKSRYTCYHKLTNEDKTVKIDEETGDAILCNNSIEVNIPLDQAVILYDEKYTNNKVITINDSVKLHLKSLSLADNIDINDHRHEIIDVLRQIEATSALDNIDDVPTEEQINTVKELKDKMIKLRSDIKDLYFYYSVDHVESGDDILKPGVDFDNKEFIEWVANCSSKAFNNLELFYANTPAVGLDFKITCPNCGNTSETSLRGLRDFFS